MTPLEITILLHYYSRANDYGESDNNAQSHAVIDAIDSFIERGLLKEDRGNTTRYHITSKGTAMVGAICSLRDPVQTWSVPNLLEDKND